MGNFFTNVQGRPDDSGNRVTRRRLAYNAPRFTSAAGVPIGAIEKGGIPVRAYALKNTGFTAGATITLGSAAVPAGYMSSADVAPATAGGAGVGPGAASPGGSLMGVEAPADTIIYAFLAGTAATAGDVTFVVEYTPAYPWSDNQGGQAS